MVNLTNGFVELVSTFLFQGPGEGYELWKGGTSPLKPEGRQTVLGKDINFAKVTKVDATTCRRCRLNLSGKCLQERLTRGTVTSTMRRAAHPHECARCVRLHVLALPQLELVHHLSR